MRLNPRNITMVLVAALSLLSLASCSVEQSTIPVQGTDCGNVFLTNRTDAEPPFTGVGCLLAAYHTCTPATLALEENEADVSWRWGLVTQDKNASCQIDYTSLLKINLGHWHAKHRTCQRVALESRGLAAYCDNVVRVFTLPCPYPQQVDITHTDQATCVPTTNFDQSTDPHNDA